MKALPSSRSKGLYGDMTTLPADKKKQNSFQHFSPLGFAGLILSFWKHTEANNKYSELTLIRYFKYNILSSLRFLAFSTGSLNIICFPMSWPQLSPHYSTDNSTSQELVTVMNFLHNMHTSHPIHNHQPNFFLLKLSSITQHKISQFVPSVKVAVSVPFAPIKKKKFGVQKFVCSSLGYIM